MVSNIDMGISAGVREQDTVLIEFILFAFEQMVCGVYCQRRDKTVYAFLRQTGASFTPSYFLQLMQIYRGDEL